MITIALRSEYIGSLLGVSITNTFLTSAIVTVLLLALAALFSYSHRRGRGRRVRSVLAALVFELLKLTDEVTGDRRVSKKILPLVATFFVFILAANLVALLPGFLGAVVVRTSGGALPLLRSPNSNLTTTLALALVSVGAIQYFSWQTLGGKKYLARFVNFRGPLQFVLGFFELLSELVKILSFSFRLFGNIFAGEVLLLVVAFLAPYFIPLPFMILEIFVGFIQAFIFAILTLTFIRLDSADPDARTGGSAAQDPTLILNPRTRGMNN